MPEHPSLTGLATLTVPNVAIPAFPASDYAPLAQSIGAAMGTRNDVVLIQAEAAVALEASATSLGRPQLRALNIVTSLYGRWFGDWLRRAGAQVQDLVATPGLPISIKEVQAALMAQRFDLVAVVHAESASGILNPLAEIVALARKAGALTVVDVVASIGGHEVCVDELGIDVAVMGPQKALGGQAGVSAVAVSQAGWQAMAPAQSTPSILSLADQKALWLDQGMGALPGTPSALEFHALKATMAQLCHEGMPSLILRHQKAASAARAGIRYLVGQNWAPKDQASNLVTAIPVPHGIDASDLLAALPQGHALGPGVGPGTQQLLRLNHTGARADLGTVLGDLAALASGLSRLGFGCDLAEALGQAAQAYSLP